MHFMHFADVIGCNSMLMLKYCKNQKFLQTFASFWSMYFILFYFSCARGINKRKEQNNCSNISSVNKK